MTREVPDIARVLGDGAPPWPLLDVLVWLFREGRRIEDIAALVEALGQRLVAAGAPVWRLRIAVATLHPQIAALGVIWEGGKPVSRSRIPHGFESSSDYRGSPVAHVFETGEPYRRRLNGLGTTDHEVLHQLAEAGAADYVALPMRYTASARPSVLAVATRHADGFSERDIDQLRVLVEFVTPVFEVLSMRSLARNLLDTYVGPRTGSRVLRGQIRRGDAEVIEAALWFSDLRGFTDITESLAMEDLLETLNTYFELVAAAVTVRGGEILRFIGDAMLIVFPAEGERGLAAATESAIDAAVDAFASLAALNHRRRRHGELLINFGVGLHVGEVVYGNVGAPDRLDFTVMGAAVNRTARLEGLTKTVGVPMLLSKDMAALTRRETRSLGRFPMKGVAGAQEVFALGAT